MSKIVKKVFIVFLHSFGVVFYFVGITQTRPVSISMYTENAAAKARFKSQN